MKKSKTNPKGIKNSAIKALFTIAVCMWVSISNAQLPTLLKDFNPTGDTYISNFVSVNGKTIFIADDGVNGYELWITDGTTTGTEMLIDINPNPGESGVGAMCPEAVNGKAYFGASSISPSAPGGADYELWVTDGTAIGTHVVKNTPGKTPGTLQPQQFKVAGNKVYYTFKDQIWVSNGTSSGTKMIEPSTGLSDAFRLFCAYNSKLLYYKYDLNDDSWDLYIIDGTTGGGSLLIDGNTFAIQPNIAPIELNGLLYFLFDDWIHHTELWVTDGTSGGTHIVKDIVTNVGSLTGNEFYSLTSFDGKLFFAADADGFDSNGFQPWVSDGTEAGTVLLKNMNCVGDFKVFNNQLYFGGNIGLPGDFELCVSDGTEAGTTFFKDLNNDPNYSSIPSNYHVLGDKMYFTAKTSGAPFHIKLFETDGTPGNTFVTDPAVVQNPNSILSYGVGVSAGKLYITANYDETIGFETYVIIGEPKLKWTGNISTNWFDKRNWNNGEVPDIFSDIKIPAGCPRYPIITGGNAECFKMEVVPGSSLTMTGGTLVVLGEITATDGNVFHFNGGTLTLEHGSNFPPDMVFNNLIIENYDDVVANNIYKFPGSVIIAGNLTIRGVGSNASNNLPRIELFEGDIFTLFKNFTITHGQIGLPYGTFPFPADPSKLPALLFWNLGTSSQRITVNNHPAPVFAGWPTLACNLVIQGANAKLYSNLEDVSMFNLEIAEDFDLAGKTITLLGKIKYVDDILSPFKITNSVPASGKITIENDPNIAYDANDPIIKVDRLRTLKFHDYSFNPNAYVIVRLGDPLAVDTLIVDGGAFLDLMGQNLTIGKTTTNAGHLQVDWLGASVANGIISLLGNSNTPRYKLVAKDINDFVLNSPAGVELNNRSDLDISNSNIDNIFLYGTAKLTKGNFDLKQTKIYLTSDVFNNDNSARIVETPGNTFTNSTNDNPPGNDFYMVKDTTINTASNNINVGGLGFFITCSNPLNNIIISRRPIHTTGLNGGSSINRFYAIQNQGAGINLNAQIKIKYDDSELQGINESNLAVFRASSNEPTGVWHEVQSSVNTTTNIVTAYGLSQLDYSTGVGETFYTLASKFIPLKSADGITNQSASNTTNVLVYPNPFNNNLNAQFISEIAESATIQLIDLNGKIMQAESVQLVKGKNDISICCTEKLNAGIYFLRITSSNTNSIVKVVKD